STYLALTGHHSPRVQADSVPPSPDDYPCLGSAVARFRPAAQAVPSFVWLLEMYRHTFAGEGGGCLGKKYDPFRVLQDPNRPDFEVQALRRPAEVSLGRLGGRLGLLEQVGRQMHQRRRSP